jgi:hypothetical protein
LIAFEQTMITQTPFRIARWAAILALGPIGWVSFASSLANVVRVNNPELALRVRPNDPAALTRSADFRLATSGATPKPKVLGAARNAALNALRSQPLSPSALRLMGTAEAAEGHALRSLALMQMSQRLSRRELGTQIWLIEEAVARNDSHAALANYDTVLRTSQTSQAQLFPILIAATEDRGLIPDFAKLLRAGPEWRFPFYAMLNEKTPSLENVALLHSMLLGSKGAYHDESSADLINRLVAAQRYKLALSVYKKLVPRDHFADLNFSRNGTFYPFDWAYADAGDVSARRLASNQGLASTFSVFFEANANTDAQLMRKLVILPAGRYQVEAKGRSETSPNAVPIYWTVDCVEGSVIANKATGAQRVTSFEIPIGTCNAQWLSLRIRTGDQPESGWIDIVSLRSD